MDEEIIDFSQVKADLGDVRTFQEISHGTRGLEVIRSYDPIEGSSDPVPRGDRPPRARTHEGEQGASWSAYFNQPLSTMARPMEYPDAFTSAVVIPKSASPDRLA